MNDRPMISLLFNRNLSAFKIAAIYLLIGAAWILFSDQLAAAIAPDHATLTTLSTLKGWGYMVVTALLLYWLIQRYTAALRDSEQHYRLLFEDNPQPMWVYDLETLAILAVNEAAIQHYGYSREEFLAMTIKDIRPPEDVPVLLDHVAHTVAVLNQAGVWRHRKKDGALIDVEVTSHTLSFAGRAARVVSAHDVTERQHTEEVLRESEARFSTVFRASPSGMSITRLADGQLIDVNPAFLSTLGYTREEVIGHTTLELNLWAEPEERSRIVTLLHEQGSLSNIELRFRRKSGELVDSLTALELIELGGEQFLLSVINDITERKRSEQILQARLLLSEFAYSHSLDELLQKMLDEAEWLTGSQIGFLHFVEADQRTLSLQSWSTNTLENTCRAEGKGRHDDIDEAGVWADCVHQRRPVIHNDYASLPHRKGFPDCHAPVIRELIVPVFRGEHIVAIVGVGNKPQDYESKDVETVSLLANLAWEITDRKRTEETLAQEHDLLRTLIDHIPDYIYVKDVDSRFLLANRSVARHMGAASPDELGGKTDMDFYPPEVAARFYADERAIMQSGQELIDHDEPNVDADGNLKWILTTKLPMRDSHGKVIGLVGVGHDLTARKEAEVERQALLEIMQGPAITGDLPAFLKLVQHSIAKVIYAENFFVVLYSKGTGLFEEVYSVDKYDPPAPPSRLEKSISAYVFRSGEPLLLTQERFDDLTARGEADLVGTDSPSWLGAPLKTSAETIGVMAVQDYENRNRYSERDRDFLASIAGQVALVVERKRGEEEILRLNQELEQRVIERTAQLQQSEEKFSKVFLVNPAAISIAAQADGRYIEVNPALSRLTGYSRDELIGHTSAELGLVDSVARAAILQSVRDQGAVHDVEIQIHTKSKRTVDVLVSVEPIELNGQPCVMSLDYDITDRKHAEAEIRRLNADLEQRALQLEAANKELESFSYSVSHDLRAPLRAIDGFARILTRKTQDELSPENQRYLDLICSNAQQMGQLIDALLTLSRSSRKPLIHLPVDMTDLVQQILANLKAEQAEHRLEIHLGELGTCQGDPTLLKQVWVNLLSNALKYTRAAEPAIIEIGRIGQAIEAVYYVKDNGVGFDMLYADKLFGVFQRLHRVEEFEGTGIGLALVQRIVARHGGRVWAQAAMGQGATFYFTLG